MSKLFYFADITNTETQTFDNSLEHFHSVGVSGTIRENIQNSIDAKIPGSNQPVKVKISLTKINKTELPGMDQVESHITSLVGGNNYTRETISHMKQSLDQSKVNVLTMEDTNTKGLSGAEQLGQETTYNIFAYKKGVHFEENDNAIEIVRGGSHGVGKIANNAASDIHLMYFANCDDKNQQHLGGTIQLIEHQLNDKCYRSTGYFTHISEDRLYHPYENEELSSIFSKKTRGLKVIIPFLRDDYADLREIVRAVCDNFFLAILESKLEVEVFNEDQEILINQDTIKQLIGQSIYYPKNIANIEEINKVFTPIYIQTYLNETPQDIEISSNTDTFHFKLYFVYNEAIKTGRVGIIRSMGMKIVDHKVIGYVRKPFNAVLIGGPKEDAYLKSLENESHTKLSEDAFRDNKAKKNARKFLKNLNRKIGQIIQSEWEQLYPSDGKIDTSDLLYEKQVSFRPKLEELSEKIELTNGKKISKNKSKERRSSFTEGGSPESRGPKEDKKISRRPRKLKPTSEKELTTETLIVPTELVHRIVFSDREVIQFNLKEIREVVPFGQVNIGLRVVDGDGREYDNEFDLKAAYTQIVDGRDGKSYDFNSYTINEVQVYDSVVKLILMKKNNRSSTLKFVYKLEVSV